MALAASNLFERFGAHLTLADAITRAAGAEAARAIALEWEELDRALPDGGLPRGVVELASPGALGGATSIALAAVRAVHAKDARAWCAWIDPEATLYAPGLARAGVDLSRLLVVRSPREELARVAVKLTSARAFEVVVVDYDALPGSIVASSPQRNPTPTLPAFAGRERKRRAWPSEVLVRKLALAAGEGGSTVMMLTDSRAHRPVPWPVALRLELSRERESIEVRVAKDKRGRGGVAKTVPLSTCPLSRAG